MQGESKTRRRDIFSI